MADLTFYSSVRRGAALAITREDFSQAPTNPDDLAHARVKVALDYGTQEHVANTILPLVGPGDIVGLDSRCIVRTFPRPDDNDAEVDFLCYVDFDQVDLPWRYTPTHYNAAVDIPAKSDRVRPWLTLLVLAEGTEVTDADVRGPTGPEKLPQLTVRTGSLLPKLDEVWAWAHVQGQQTQTDDAIAATLAGRPGALVARLMSPRALDKTTAYRAFLVPTFKRGVLAAQGVDLTTDANKAIDIIEPAWQPNPQGDTVLPIYYSWRFQTGSVASFREVARQLRPAADLPDTLGQRAIEVSTPGFLLTPPTGDPTQTPPQMQMGGALQTTLQAGQADPSIDAGWVNGLSNFIASGILNTPDHPRVVAPPLYGRWYAAEDHLDKVPPTTPPGATNPSWFSVLNKDPRHRVAAGLGTEVVQRDQQALLAAALDQTSRVVDNVNRVRKVMQSGREVFLRMVTRHLDAGSTYSTLLITSFLHGKILNCTGATPRPTIGGIWKGSPFGGIPHPWRRRFPFDPQPVIDKINNGDYNPNPNTPPGTPTPDITLGGTVPGGLPDPGVGTIISTMNADQRLYWGVLIFWVARRLLSTESGKYWWLLRRLLRLGMDLIQLASTQGVQGVQAVAVLEKLRAGTLSSTDFATLPIASSFVLVQRDPILGNPASWPTQRTPSVGGSDPPDLVLFKQAAGALFDYVNGTPLLGPIQTKVNVPNLVNCILTSLSPTVTFVAAEKARHQRILTLTWNAPDELEPILVTPRISFPVWSLLRDVSVDWILPGVADLPRNSVSLVTTNQKFIEAFMVGLNHEMNRELLWNGYPTDQRGTYFQQFWDFRGWVASTTDANDQRTEDQFADISEVKGWGASDLGTHSGRPKSVNLVLLVRGDVIKRYPNVVVYASPAIQAQNQPAGVLTLDDAHQQHPVFQAILTGDIAFYGFEISADDARGINGNLGYFFVLQEHPAEPKFNFQGTAPNAEPTDYPDPTDPNAVAPTVAGQVGANAFETPTRVAIHGKDLLP